MSSIEGIQHALRRGSVTILRFAWDGGPDDILTLSFSNEESEEHSIRFKGVTDLELRGGPWLTPRLTGLTVEDITNRQMEGKRIRVATEDDSSYLFFYCEAAELIA